MKKGIFSSLVLASYLFITSVANAGNYSVINFYTQVVNSAFIEGMKEKDNEKILTQDNIDCISSANNQELFSLIENALKKELSANELYQANNFLNSRIGQMLQSNIISNNGTINALEHLDDKQFSDSEISSFKDFTQSTVNKKIFMGNDMEKIVSQPDTRKSLTEIAKKKITTCNLSIDYFFK